MGLLDLLGSSGGGGLLDFLRNNAMNQQFPSGQAADQAQYGSQPSGAMAQMPYAQPQMAAQPPSQPQMAPQVQAPPQTQQNSMPLQDSGAGLGDRLGAGFRGLMANAPSGPIGAIFGGVAGLAGMGQGSAENQTAKALLAKGVDPQTVQAAIRNPAILKQVVEQAYGPHNVTSLGEGYVYDPYKQATTRAYVPSEKTPTSVQEFEYGQSHPGFRDSQLEKTRAGAAVLNNQNNIDMNSGQTYDKQLAEGLGKSHASLANGVEDAQTRARDIAAMQGAVDAIQKNGGSTGGLAPAQRLELQKSINAGASALGIEKPFNESDLSDKEFLTKFNRSMAGAQAKGAVGSRVTNFEMSNFLKANPGLDMTPTGNQRLLGIQAQIEERNIAVGNAIRDATAEAISGGKKINPVEVQKIIKSYDDGHHIKDVVTGQDLTQSYALPEFQNTPSNASLAKAHDENLKSMEKTIGGVTYEQRNGQWYPKK